MFFFLIHVLYKLPKLKQGKKKYNLKCLKEANLKTLIQNKNKTKEKTRIYGKK